MARYEMRAAAFQDEFPPSPVRDPPTGDPMPQPAARRVPPATLEVRGNTLKVHFFGGADNDWNLAERGIGINSP